MPLKNRLEGKGCLVIESEYALVIVFSFQNKQFSLTLGAMNVFKVNQLLSLMLISCDFKPSSYIPKVVLTMSTHLYRTSSLYESIV